MRRFGLSPRAAVEAERARAVHRGLCGAGQAAPAPQTVLARSASSVSLPEDVRMTDTNHELKRGSVTTAATVSAAVVAAALAAAACTTDSLTEPARQLTPAATLAIAPDARMAAAALLDDASVRLMPSLADAAARAKLRGFLDDLSAALEGENPAKARRQIALARKMIAALAASPDAADLAALGMMLDHVDAQLNDATGVRLDP
jgi:hypothetical protein